MLGIGSLVQLWLDSGMESGIRCLGTPQCGLSLQNGSLRSIRGSLGLKRGKVETSKPFYCLSLEAPECHSLHLWSEQPQPEPRF